MELEAPHGLGFDTFNLGRDARSIDAPWYVRTRWPYVPAELSGNACLLSTDKARRTLGYRPRAWGRYIDPRLVW